METSSRSGHATRFAWVVIALVTIWAVTVVAGESIDTAPLSHRALVRTSAAAGADPAIAAKVDTDSDDPRLPSPEAVPDAGVELPIGIYGRIQIPAIGVDTGLLDQITQQSIDIGPSHWPGSAAIGGLGNAVIAGHRVTHGAPFRHLDRLVPGDPITLVDTEGALFTYAVTEVFVVSPDSLWITNQTTEHTLTLFTCHPLHSAEQRLVVRATLKG